MSWEKPSSATSSRINSLVQLRCTNNLVIHWRPLFYTSSHSMAYKQKCLKNNNIPVISRKRRSRDHDQEPIPNRVFSSPPAPEGRPLKRASSNNSITSTSTKSRYKSRSSRRNIFRMLFPAICSPKRLATTNGHPATPSKISYSNTATSETDVPNTSGSDDYFAFESLQGASRNLTHQLKGVSNQDEQVSNQFSRLSLSPKPSLFEVPEIVSLILQFLDEMSCTIPLEHPPVRRAPLSYQHAYLIHGNHETAEKVWCESQVTCNKQQRKVSAGLFSCMLVNRMWHRIALERLESKVYFADESKLVQFSSRPTLKNSKSKTELFILHKLTHAKQVHVDAAAEQISGKNLKWLEFYTCPKVLPPVALFSGAKLKKLVLPGNSMVNDEFLTSVSLLTPNLETLDVRACELVSDYGIYSVAQNCPLLSHLNVGRHSKGHLITDSSIAEIGRKTQIRTLGLAGCHITDRSIWEICLTSGSRMERLSLNNCFLLTNNSLPKVLSMNYLPVLSVLEIRRCLEITNLRPFVEFKRRQQSRGFSVLIEGCEQIEAQMRETELLVDMEVSQRVMKDIQEYLDKDDEDC